MVAVFSSSFIQEEYHPISSKREKMIRLSQGAFLIIISLDSKILWMTFFNNNLSVLSQWLLDINLHVARPINLKCCFNIAPFATLGSRQLRRTKILLFFLIRFLGSSCSCFKTKKWQTTRYMICCNLKADLPTTWRVEKTCSENFQLPSFFLWNGSGALTAMTRCEAA